MKLWMIFAVMISTSVWADQASHVQTLTDGNSTATVVGVHSGTNMSTSTVGAGKPAAKKPAVRAAKKPKPELRTVPLVPGPAVVSVSPSSRVMVRGKAGLIGEVITRMTNGEPVIVIEEVALKHSKNDEPSVWAKVVLPDQAHPWVNTPYIDATNKTVKPKTLNLRAGPGENYSVIGSLNRGDTVTEVETKGEWMEIQAPTNAFAFIAAAYLKQETPMLAAVPAESATVPESPAIPPAGNPTVENPPVAEPPVTMPAPAVEEPPPPRIVQREGIVHGTFSIQAPTRYELVSPDNGKPINYLYTTSTNLDLGRYKGLHLIVTGEESLDERWKNTPVITIQRIVVLE